MTPTSAAAIFFLVLGQADGRGTWDTAGSGGLATIPAHYETLALCEAAGEAARANNLGLSYLSYTCVPAEVNVEAGEAPKTLHESVSKSKLGTFALEAVVARECQEVCEIN